VKELKAASGVYPFQVNAPMWNDYGVAERLVALPGESSIDTREALWRFPSNAVLARTITLEMERGNSDSKKRIETQLLHHTGDGWGAYSYRWNAEQTDAELVAAEGADELLKVKDAAVPGGVRLQPWRFSSRAECLRCHNTWCGSALGFQPEQLGNQMDELAQLKLIAGKPKEKKQLVSPYDVKADLNARARSYLHINCSHCHRDNAGGSVPTVLNFELPLEKMRSVDARAVLGDLGLVDGKVIAPGKPFSSVLLFRTSATGRTRMPYIGTELVDEEGVALLREWIASLDGKPGSESVKEVVREIGGGATVARFTANSSTALMLAHALAEPSVSPEKKEQVALEARKSSNPLIADLFERFLPAEMRANVLQPTARREDVLALSGDVKRGTALLNDSARSSCLQCHQYRDAGRAFGPSFAAIKKGKEEILDSILEPSREVAPEFVLYTVETGEDEVLSGMIVKRTVDEMVVRDATGTDHVLPSAKVKSSRPQQLSAMPEGLLAGLSAQEVADLIAAIIAETK
jgi:putative heme-binding domain-containing protein